MYFSANIPLNSNQLEDTMGFKKMKTNLTFTDISLFSSIEKNRAIKRMEQINAIVDWSRIENLLMRNYPVGKSAEGNEAYPPMILMKCLLLQQWFHIDSDPDTPPSGSPCRHRELLREYSYCFLFSCSLPGGCLGVRF